MTIPIIITKNSFDDLKSRFKEFNRVIPYYKNIDSHKIEQSKNISELLNLFPAISKKEMIAKGSDLYELGDDHILLLAETSGTTGNSLFTPRSKIELDWNSKNIALGFNNLLDKGDRVAIINPGIMSPFAEACGIALASLNIPYLRMFPVKGVCSYERMVEVLLKYNITSIMTTPSLSLIHI